MKTDNELIAEFMGMTLGTCHGQHGAYKDNGTYEPDFIAKHSLELYQTSWDWLMPVVEKIEESGAIIEIFMALTYGCRISIPGKSVSFINDNNGGFPSITGVYNSSVEFIKWYNTQKTN